MSAGVAHAWEENHLGVIKDEQLSARILDLCLKHGGRHAIRLLQQALNEVFSRKIAWLPLDGVLGPATQAFANSLPAEETLKALKRLDK